MPASDPRATVEAPVREALARLVVAGAVLFVLAVIVGLCTRACGLDPGWRMTTHVGAAVVMLVYIGGIDIAGRLARRPGDDERANAWSRAYEVDRLDATAASVVVAAVPVGVLAALVLLVWPHLMEPESRAEEYGLWLPVFAILWVTATLRWIDACRDHLARALRVSEQRFRGYWSAPGA